MALLSIVLPAYNEEQNIANTVSVLSGLLEENGIGLFEKHFSLVTPRDFYELEQTDVVFEGTLHELNRSCLRYSGTRTGIFRQAMQKLSYVMNGAV